VLCLLIFSCACVASVGVRTLYVYYCTSVFKMASESVNELFHCFTCFVSLNIVLHTAELLSTYLGKNGTKRWVVISKIMNYLLYCTAIRSDTMWFQVLG